jgi:carbon-monoxide dehydrogenase large subunit
MTTPEKGHAMASGSKARETLRVEDFRLLRGKGRFIDDLKRPHQAFAYFVRSPVAHATIDRIDVAGARAHTGVLAVYTWKDVAADGLGHPPMRSPLRRPDGQPAFHSPHPGLARDRVRYVGDPVVMIVAESVAQAKDAAEIIEIDFGELPANAATDRATDDTTPDVWDENPGNVAGVFQTGDADATEAAFASAAHIVKRRFKISRVHAQYLEPRGVLGEYDETDGRYTLTVDVQYPHRVRNVLSEFILKVPEQDVRVVSGDIGGGFGTKGWQYVEHRLAVWAARKLGRPIKWTCERSEMLLADEHARDNVTDAELALDAEGRMLALRVRTKVNVGAYVSSVRNFAPAVGAVGLLIGMYAIPAAHVSVACVQTNTNPTAPYRGAGRPEANFVIERMVDEAARELGIDRIELRRQNLIPEAAMPYKTPLTFTYDCGAFEQGLEKLLDLADIASFESRRAEARGRGRLRGLGIANSIEHAAGIELEFAEIRFSRSGSALILVGTKNQGQGHETMYRRIAADCLGMSLSDFRVVEGDTDKVAYGVGTMGSRSTVMGGSALYIAAQKVIDKAKRIAAHLLEVAEHDLAFENGRFTVPGTDRSMPLEEVVRCAFEPARLPAGMEPGLYETGTFGDTRYTFPNGCHACEVEIDPETGTIEIVSYSVVEDVGTVINPITLAGQMHGGIAQGAGQILAEQVVYDDSAQLLDASLMDYALPHAADIPFICTAGNPVPTKQNPLGVKGAGEAGTCGAMPAVMNAVMDALAQVGVTELDMPASPARVWKALNDRIV